jgi:hypothetical protein
MTAFESSRLACPCCNSAGLRYVSVSVIDQHRDNPHVRLTRVEPGQRAEVTTVLASAREISSGRRGGLIVGFYCKRCGAIPILDCPI